MNYYPERDGRIAGVDRREPTTSELVAQHLKGAKVAKVFNPIPAVSLGQDGKAYGMPDRRALPIASDAAAEDAITDPVNQPGYDAVHARPLPEGLRFENGSSVCARLFDADQFKEALGVND